MSFKCFFRFRKRPVFSFSTVLPYDSKNFIFLFSFSAMSPRVAAEPAIVVTLAESSCMAAPVSSEDAVNSLHRNSLFHHKKGSVIPSLFDAKKRNGASLEHIPAHARFTAAGLSADTEFIFSWTDNTRSTQKQSHKNSIPAD